MRHTHDGLTIWYGTHDAPAPSGLQEPGRKIPVMVGMSPPSPANSVSVHYRVNGSPLRTLAASVVRTDYAHHAQYFVAHFAQLAPRTEVTYGILGRCAGRQVPAPPTAGLPTASFQVAPRPVVSPAERSELAADESLEPRYQVKTELLAKFTVEVHPPRVVGPTPDGIRVTWNARVGKVVGPRLNAKVLQGADWMRIRPDGMGMIDVRAILETTEGAMILMTYDGMIELGRDGYENFLKQKYPKAPPAWTAPRFLTADADYAWLNRLQCVSVGQVLIDELTYKYDVFALLS